MKLLFEAVNDFFGSIVGFSDLLWDFPKNFEWYANIPVLGQVPFAIFLLIGMGIYFTIRTKGVQFRFFKHGIRALLDKHNGDVGVSQLASFMLSTAERVGPGNIMGVTGAISIGGPGAVFWMWVAALFGMASSFIEATLAQIFKERDGKEYVGGLPFYAQKIFGNRRWLGIAISISFILYALLCVPIQTFHVFTASGSAASLIAGITVDRESTLYYVIAVILIIGIAITIFGGIKRVTSVTDKMVPVMAVVYAVIILALLVINIGEFPRFITSVIGGAFKPDAIFGGTFGVALAQGVKRGLLSNEAGQGTVTPAAAITECDHPCSQGFVQSLGVFLDTIVICTCTAFVVCGARLWETAPDTFEAVRDSKIDFYLNSLTALVPGTMLDGIVSIIICLCYALFAFTSLLGLISFAVVISANISKNKKFTVAIRALGALIFVPIGTICVLSGMELDNIWYASDLFNIALVFINAPTILVGGKYAFLALKDYAENNGRRFVSSEIGIESDIWTLEARQNTENNK